MIYIVIITLELIDPHIINIIHSHNHHHHHHHQLLHNNNDDDDNEVVLLECMNATCVLHSNK